MQAFPPSMQKLIADLSRLPSIGEKSATRLAYHLLANDRNLGPQIADSIRRAMETVRFCERCFYFSEENLCSVCRNTARDQSLLCVVEKPMDLIAIERVGEFKGYYHVLHGLWAPLRGHGPEKMKLKELVERVKVGLIKEVIMATSSTVEGDATSLYLARILNDLGVKATRLAQGMPKGGELEYADDVTLSRAMLGRNQIIG